MEYFRSLPYDSVGVVAGYPAGTVPQNSTTSLLNGIGFSERVRIDYVDDLVTVLSSWIPTVLFWIINVRLEYVWEISGQPSVLQLLV